MSNCLPKLNCAVGDLAITVNSSLPENLGNIVRVISPVGFLEWPRFKEPLYTWNVEIASEAGLLHYRFNKELKTAKFGPVPDRCLRRLTPPQGYLMEEFADSEQLQMNFHEEDVVESESNV